MSSAIKGTDVLGVAEKRALVAERLRKAARERREAPLSFAQQRLWFLEQLEPNSPLYNVCALGRVRGALDIHALEQALNALVARHEPLRTRFQSQEDGPVQFIDPARELALPVVDLSHRPSAEREAETQRQLRSEINRPFVLATEHPLRATLLRLEERDHRLVLILHHLVADEWSLKVLFRELAALYSGFLTHYPAALPPLPIQYADYARWQRHSLHENVFGPQLEYWRQQLRDYPPPTALATDHPRGAVPTFNGKTAARPLGQQLTRGVKELATRHEATPFMVLLAAFKTLLHRYTGLEDLIVCSPVAGRTRVETEDLIGFFVNTLPLRTSLAGNPTFEQVLARVRQATLGALGHQDVPFERLVEALQPERTLSHLPFTRLMFVYQSGTGETFELPGATLHLDDAESEWAKFDATLVLRETGEGLVAKVEYNRDLFDNLTITRLLAHLEILLRGIVAEPSKRIAELPLLSAGELDLVVREWNQTSGEYPRQSCIHEVFEAQAKRAPEATALIWGQQRMSYGELNARANQLARSLRQFDVGPDMPVGLCVERSMEMVIGMLGILKAGGAYVPLDATYPKERLAFMLEDAGARVVLTQQRLLSRLPPSVAKRVCLDADWDRIGRERPESPSNVTEAGHLAYVMYTSGSTGEPKGVAVPHRGVLRLVLNPNYIQLGATDRIAQVSNISFDAATFELWGALLNGGAVIGITKDVALTPNEFARELKEQGITAMFLTAALFNQLAAEAPGAFETLSTVIAGGEALDPKWVQAVLADRGPRRLVNGYGPTENTTFTCCHLIRDLDQQSLNVPIGRPISNTAVYILDRHLNPVPIGVTGELYTGGDGLARGYWNRPELTAEKFIHNPFDATGASRLYRTGDLARYLPDGTIECLGRIDDQVKVRGHRIELGEIETQLGRHPAVSQCVVVVNGDSSAKKRLVAYVVPRKDGVLPGAGDLRGFLSERLPQYMLPSAFVNLGALPLTPNGKVDRKALPDPDQARPNLDHQFVAPRDDTERKLAGIWENVLGVKPVGVRDKFFDLGGHSMLAMRVIGQVEKAFGRKPRLATIFQTPTIEGLAAVLRGEVKESSLAGGTSLVEIQGAGSRCPLFLVHGAGGGMFWGYVNLARCLGNTQPVYGFQSRGLDGQEEFTRIEHMAAQYVRDLRRVQPHGPYCLGGYCFGGNVAYEMACQLAEQREHVALLALLNCAPPHSRYTEVRWSVRWAWRFARNLLYWANYFGNWTPRQRGEFFRWKWQLVKKRTAHFRQRGHREQARLEPGDLVDLASYTPEQRIVWEAHIRALIDFHPRRYPGRVHLFRSPGHPLWCSFDEDYGWGDLALGGVELITIPGAHEKILEEPYVRALAARLSAVLEGGKPGRPLPLAPTAATAPAGLRGAADNGGQCGDWAAPVSVSAEPTYPQLFTGRTAPPQTGVALRFGEEQMTYAELDRRSNQLARYLQQQGVGPETLVGVALERSLDLGVALLAVLKAGGAYLPLDLDYPRERLSFMVADARPVLLLTHSRVLGKLPTEQLRAICLDEPAQQTLLSQYPEQNVPVPVTADNLAYVIYTSGSTGQPKGVQITHRALANHNLAIVEAYELGPADRLLQFTALNFDISVEEIFPTWLAGATLVFRTEGAVSSMDHFLRFIAAEEITVLNLPTAYWHELMEFLESTGARLPQSARLVIVGGEKASEQAYARWKRCVPPTIRLMNGYGATEATITTTLYLARRDEESLPIGRPIANTAAIVLDDQLHPVPAGEEGELFIGGAGLARGYLNRPELTARVFIPNPVPSLIDSERLYRTGDRARVRPGGDFEFIGRLDDQIKIRGFRIELGEIEAALRSHAEVKDAAVVARQEAAGPKRLVAYYVPKSTPGPGLGELHQWLKRSLPVYMLPGVLVCLPNLPLTPAGKVDRSALPAPARTRPNLDCRLVAATSELEKQLTRIWCEILEVSPIGVRDDFIELGGHSLLATRMVSRIRDTFGVELSLADFFARPTIAALAQHLSRLLGDGAPAELPSSLLTGAIPVPLSPFQERIWFLDQLDPKRTAYNRALGIQLSGPLNVRALEKSLSELTKRQEALRAVFPAENGQPKQLVASSDQVTLVLSDLSRCAEAQRESQARELVAREASRPYILAQPGLRALLLRLSQTEHWLVLVVNEIVADERSLGLILDELPALYAAAAAAQSFPPAPSALPYAQVVASVPGISAEVQARQLEYWTRQLADAPALLDLPADRPRPAQGDYAGARCSFELDGALAQALTRLAVEHQGGLLPIFLAGLAGLLHRYTGSSEIVIGAATSLRSHATRNLVGPFENRVALRCDLSGSPSFSELVKRCKTTIDGALANKEVPFRQVIAAVLPQMDSSYTPLFQVFLSVQEEALPGSSAAGVSFAPFEIDTRTSRYDLSLKLVRRDSGFSAQFKYNTALFDAARIERMAQHLLVLLESGATEPQRLVSKLGLLSKAESNRLLKEWTATERPYAFNKTLVDLFQEQVQRAPAAEALVCGARRLTYAELHRRAVHVALDLKALGVAPGSLVGVCLERTADMVAALLGTLLAGAAYVPLDPAYPVERLAFTLQDAKVKVLLTQTALKGLLPQRAAPVLCLDSLGPARVNLERDSLEAAAGPGDLAYVIYTSGSTGRPKGVAIEHRNAVAFVSWAKDTFSPEELSGVLAATSICFDLSVFELFVPLCWGGKVILVENALALKGAPAAGEVRLVNTVPSAVRELLRLQAVPAGVQVINLAGEPLSTELVDQIYKETSVRKVFDLYGPTETTTYSTGGPRQAGQPASIGRPLANEQVYLLDAHLELVPIGVPGELFIGGAGVARGYLHRPELTAEKFVANPFRAGERLYRTGDLARWRADGNLEYLGRLDHQVKIRGFRIELGEVESALKKNPGVAAALVMAREDHPGDKRLVGYVVPASGIVLDPPVLKDTLRQLLPEFMIPSDFVFLEALPMTPNGKVDRKALPSPEPRSSGAGLVLPQTPAEEQLSAIWREVLHREQVGVSENFFDLGGHSLLAVRIISAIRDQFKIELPLSALFSSPTISGLAGLLSGAASQNGPTVPMPIARIARTGNLPVSFVQERLWFLDQLEPGSPAYNVPSALRLTGLLDLNALRQAFHQLGARHEALRSSFKYTDQGLSQVIAEELCLPIPCADVVRESATAAEPRLREMINQAARQPFDLSSGPLIRVSLFRLEPSEHVLLLVLHHTIADGWSLALLLQELAALYDALADGNASVSLPPLPIQYADFAHWQRHAISGPTLQKELAHWKAVLEGAPAELELPLDHPRPARSGGRAGALEIRWQGDAFEQLAAFGKHHGCTPFILFLTGLAITLRKWSGQRDMVLGTVVAGRTRSQLEGVLGCFMNFLPLRAKVQDADRAGELLSRVRGAVLDAQSHQDCPFEKIVEAVNPQRRANQNPLYNVGLLLQNFPPNLFPSSHLKAESVPVSLQAALLDLRFEIEAVSNGFSLTCEYRRDLFEPETINALLGSWRQAIQTLVETPDLPVADFELSPALHPKSRAARPSAAPPTITITATFTAEPVADSLQYWLRRLEMAASVEFAPYNQVFQQLLDPQSLLAGNRYGLNIILARLEDWQAGSDSQSDPEQNLERSVGEFRRALEACAGRSSVPFLVCLCPASAAALAPVGAVARFNTIRAQLEADLKTIGGVFVLSSDELGDWYPVREYDNPAGEELGRVPYTTAFFTALGTALARKFHALNRPPFKVIALDCDNTLWRGVCGEEGPQGIELDDPRRALQVFMGQQRNCGMLLCLCSKNNEADVQAVFSQRSEMPLRLSDFAALRLNWRPKSENLKDLAAELGLGLESFVFVDDNPVECAEVAANCPEVLTLQLPEQPLDIPLFLKHCWAFDHLKLTTEDRQRAELYDQNRQREQLRAQAPSLQEFLAGLELKTRIEPIAAADGPRVSQLTQRTNQFNFTTRRFSEHELGRWLESGAGLSVRVSDRFGDYGLVGTILYRFSGQTLEVDNWLLSCRVLGRGVEYRLLARLAEIARERGACWLDLHFVPSAKNKPALDFLERIGKDFKQPLNGGSVFRLPVEAAARVALQPVLDDSRSSAKRSLGVIGAPTRPLPGSGGRFSGCHQIAVEAGDLDKLQESIRASGPVRKRDGTKYVPPGTDLERKLCGLWEQLLPVQPIGIRDDFFELGGHSLLAVRLFAEIQKMLGRRFPLVTLFQAPTIEQLARVLSGADGASSLLVPIQPNGTKPPLFLVHGAGGDVLWGYANLAAHLPADQPVYGIKSEEKEPLDQPVSLEEMARAYLAAVRERQPQGPYYLGGYCFGGNVAYEMARQLQLQGQKTALVVLFDTAPANAGYETLTWWRPGFAWRFARNLRYWLVDFVALNPEDRRRFFGRKLRCLGRKWKRRLGMANGSAGFDLEEIIDKSHFPERELKLWQAHLEALITHIERPYEGRVALVRTLGQTLFCSLEEDFCWGKLVKGGVTVRCVPGSHESIFMEPNVRTLAAELAGLLQPASQRSSSRAEALSVLHTS